MADFVRTFLGRLILWYPLLVLDPGGRSYFGPWRSVSFWTLVVGFILDLHGRFCFGTKKNDFEMSRNKIWELFVHVISLWNMNFGLVLSGG